MVENRTFYLFDERGNKVVSVLTINKNYVYGMRDSIFAKQEWQMTDEELNNFKRIHNLKYEHELNDQMNIFDVI